MVNDPNSGKTPKYTIAEQAGYYPPMEKLVGRNGLISMFLQPKKGDNSKSPAMWLQAKNSLNFTGLKDFFIDGKLSGYAYGYPSDCKTYSNKKKENFFFEYKNDGFLFIVKQDPTALTASEQIKPTTIELIVLEGGKVLISSYCKQLMMGGFDEQLTALRVQAGKQVDLY
jgi:hypothetical protein